MEMRVPKAPRLNRVSLRFANKNFERRFEQIYLSGALPLIRLSLLLGGVLYGLFGFLDAYIMADAVYQVWLIRYAIVIPVLLGIAAFTYNRHFVALSQYVMTFAVLVSGGGVVAMTIIGPDPASHWYYAGLIMVVIFSSTAIRLHYTYSLTMSLVLLALYELSAVILNPVPPAVLANNSFFLVMSIAVGAVTNYTQEYILRMSYVKTRLLELEMVRSERLRRKADTANRAKTEFLANMSHELRTPMNAIMGFSEIMVNEMFGPLGTSRYAGYAKDIHLSARHLLSIINDILDLSKAEAGKMTIDESGFDLCELATESMRMLRTQAGSKGLRFTLKTPGFPMELRADKRLVRQVLINIVANATKFTEPGGSVNVTIEQDDSTGEGLIVVSDTGVGMTKDEIKRCIEPFTQIEGAYTRNQPGVGLGLPMVAKIMEIHGGSFKIRSIVGQGTTASAHFPPERVLTDRDAFNEPQSDAGANESA
jgi:signal transduction histidine kinase